jgi:hypothetical protein
VESSALPADCAVRRLVRSARGWGGGFSRDPSSPPANVDVAWCRLEKPSDGNGADRSVAQFSYRLQRHRPLFVAGDKQGAIRSPRRPTWLSRNGQGG